MKSSASAEQQTAISTSDNVINDAIRDDRAEIPTVGTLPVTQAIHAVTKDIPDWPAARQ